MQQHAARSIKQMCLPDVVAPGVVSVRPDDDIVAVDCYRNPKIVIEMRVLAPSFRHFLAFVADQFETNASWSDQDGVELRKRPKDWY